MKDNKIVKKYYVGFLTDAIDPLPSYSCYSENHHIIKTTSKPTKKDLSFLFYDNHIKENWVHIFIVKETLFDFNDIGFKSKKESEYLISYSRDSLDNCFGYSI